MLKKSSLVSKMKWLMDKKKMKVWETGISRMRKVMFKIRLNLMRKVDMTDIIKRRLICKMLKVLILVVFR